MDRKPSDGAYWSRYPLALKFLIRKENPVLEDLRQLSINLVNTCLRISSQDYAPCRNWMESEDASSLPLALYEILMKTPHTTRPKKQPKMHHSQRVRDVSALPSPDSQLLLVVVMYN